MQLPPESVIASWPKPNYVDYQGRGCGLLVVNVVFSALATILVALRLCTRLKITATFGLDDIFSLLALPAAIAMCTASSIASEHYGWDRHVWDVPLTWLPMTAKLTMAFQITFSVASLFTKLSLLWFCRRILGAGIKGPFRRLNYCLIAAMIVVTLLSLIFIFITIFQCIPVHAYWDLNPTYPHHCLDGNTDVFAASVVNLFNDFLTTVVPMPLIWRLKLPARQRLAVIAIFGLGVLANVAGAVRTYYVWKAMIDSYDQTWYAWPIAVAGAVEINLGIICACAPALRPLITSILPRLFPSLQERSTYGRSRGTGKRWNSTQNSRIIVRSGSRRDTLDGGRNIPTDQIRIMRTVEMETYYELHEPPQDHDKEGFVDIEGARNRETRSKSSSESIQEHGIV